MQKPILLLIKIWFLSGAFSLLSVPIAHAVELTCPALIQMPHDKEGPSAEGWEVSSRSDRLMNDGGIVSSGNPKDWADLKGEDTVVDGRKGVKWDDLDSEDDAQGIWFSCSYGQWAVLLSKKVEGKVSTCWSPNGLPVKLICK